MPFEAELWIAHICVLLWQSFIASIHKMNVSMNVLLVFTFLSAENVSWVSVNGEMFLSQSLHCVVQWTES